MDLEELRRSLFATSKGLLALWLVRDLDPYRGLPEDLSLSWPEIGHYLVELARAIPSQSPKLPGRPREIIRDTMPYLVWMTIKGATGQDHYRSVRKIVEAAGYPTLAPDSMERNIRRLDKKLESRIGQKPS